MSFIRPEPRLCEHAKVALLAIYRDTGDRDLVRFIATAMRNQWLGGSIDMLRAVEWALYEK